MFLTAFIDMLGVGIVIPVLPALFLDLHGAIFPPSFSLAAKAITLGLLLASYPFAQFIGAPIIGALSDRKGRKPILLLSLFGTFIGYVLFGVAIAVSNIWILFFSRLLDGFTGGNISTLYSAVADISEEKDKPKRFGIIGMGIGLGYILGPFIGGHLSDKALFQMFHNSMPFWFIAGLALLNIVLVGLMFKETLKDKLQSKMDPFVGFRNILKAAKIQNLRTVYLYSFVVAFGFNLFLQFFAFYLLSKFRMSQAEAGNFFAYAGIWIAISQGIIAGIVAKKHSAQKVLPLATILLAVSTFMLVFPTQYSHMLLILPFIAVFQGLIVPNITTLLSDLANKNSQGEVMGINQSLNSLTQIVPPIIAGVLFSISIDLPIITAAIIIVIAWIIFEFGYNRKQRKVFNEI